MLYSGTPNYGRSQSNFGRTKTRKVPPAKGLRRRYPGAPAGMHPSQINNTYGGHPSDESRQAFIPNERMLNDPQVRMELMRRLRTRRKSGDRFKAMGI